MITTAPSRADAHFLSTLPPTLIWTGGDDGHLDLLDQTLLPTEIRVKACHTAHEVWEAIRALRVRGAPAIGVAAAYGLCLGTREASGGPLPALRKQAADSAVYLRGARPTAVNLAWALARVAQVAEAPHAEARAAWRAMLAEAHAIAREDAETCRRIGEVGASLIPVEGGVLTHCNAGALATVAYGTATAPLYLAHAAGRRFRVFVDETRPLLQGARLTALELLAAGLDVTLLCDNAAASLLRSGVVQLVIVGADRIAANGDTANKIGTYGLALAARHHGVPFYVAAPRSTFDLSLPSGAQIPIERRAEDEVRRGLGGLIAPPHVRCHNPAFDMTPAELISGIVTEVGIVQPVTAAEIRRVFEP